MSLTHLAEVFGITRTVPVPGYDRVTAIPPQGGTGTVYPYRPRANPPMPQTFVDCAYCGNELTGPRCQSCGAPRRRSLAERIRAALPCPARIETR